MSKQLTHRIAFCALAFAFAACDSDRQTVTAPSPPPTAAPPSLPPPGPPPPSPNPGGDPIVGGYTLTLDVGSGCGTIPDAARIRRYSATIDSTGEAAYLVTLGDASFLTGLICTLGPGPMNGIGCHQFLASRRGDILEFNLVNNNDDAHGGHIVEHLPSGTWIEIIGTATGRLEQQTIEAAGTSSVWYCETPLGYPFPCPRFVGCRSDDMRLTFKRTAAPN